MTALYFPPPDAAGEWRRAAPEAAGLDGAALAAAVDFAAAHETPWGRDLREVIGKGHFELPPWNGVLGPVRPRGAPNGLLLRHGTILAEWGDTQQVDMTFSVAKSYLSLLAGIAHARGLLPDPQERVAIRIDDGGFDPPHNHRITWEQLLQQTSEWEGEMWGKPDLVDRNRDLALEGRGNPRKGEFRALEPPGTWWEYNDVRINRLSLALLRLFRRPLPEVFAEAVMAPIGASGTWEWHGYRNSTVEIDGRPMESVSGGGHWGGGVFIHARDQARLGLLMLARGEWAGRRVLPERWIERSTTPCPINPQYGYLWWLNTGRRKYPSAPQSSVFASGAGGNLTWIEPETGIVAVLRWIDPAQIDGFIARVMAAVG
jgi:CubicO group peptidase (beta-lactamase class C family)